MSTSVSARLFRLVWGNVERPLVPVIAVTLLSTIAFAALWSYIAIWAVTYVHANSTAVGVLYALDAIAAAVGGYFGGRLSDLLGRRAVIGLGWGAEATAALALAGAGRNLYLGFALVILAGAASGPGLAATNAIVADLVPEPGQEAAYATIRVASNIGFMAGPPLGALALVGGHWWRLFIGVGVVGVTSAALGFLFLPATRSAASPAAAPQGGAAVARLLISDKPFVLLLLCTLLGFVVYVAYEVVLPISAVSSFGLSPAAWGLLVIINPILVTLAQVRVTQAARGIPVAPRLGLAMLLMGLPFLLLQLNTSIPVIVAVIVIFVFGEMIWAPTSQALAAHWAPAHLRGTYMGAFGASSSAAWAIGPLVTLHLRGSYGNGATWIFFAVVAAGGALAGMLACRLAAQFQRPAPATVDA